MTQQPYNRTDTYKAVFAEQREEVQHYVDIYKNLKKEDALRLAIQLHRQLTAVRNVLLLEHDTEVEDWVDVVREYTELREGIPGEK